MDIKNLHVIINPAAGQNEPILNTLNDVLYPASVKWEVHITTEHATAGRLALNAAENDADAIAVYGGDGTVVAVCNALVNHDVPVAILPGGTANALSSSLSIPQSLKQAVELIISDGCCVKYIDVGRVGDKFFTVALATGFMAETVGKASRESKDQLGVLAYTTSLLEQMQNYKPATYTIMLDNDETVTFDAVACNVLNVGTFGLGQISLVPESRATDGYLHIIAFETSNIGQLASALATAASMEELPFSLPRWKAKTIQIKADPTHPWMMDGEVEGETPLDIRIEPEALPFIVPVSADL